MRLRDPRRFGAVLWHEGDVADIATSAAGQPRAGTAGTEFDAQPPLPATRYAQRRDQARHHGQPCRGRRRQHLRQRSPVPCRHPPAARRQQTEPAALRAAGANHTGSAARGHRRKAAAPCATSSTATAPAATSSSTISSMAEQASMQTLRHPHQTDQAGTALEFLLRDLPEIDSWRISHIRFLSSLLF